MLGLASRSHRRPNRIRATGLGLLLAVLLGGCATSSESPIIGFDTQGGDAWIFDKLISGQISPRGCNEVLFSSDRAAVRAWISEDATRFAARVPLRSGSNDVSALCLDGATAAESKAAQRWHLRLDDTPKAWIRTRVDNEGIIHLDAGRSTRADGIPAPITQYAWAARHGNPAPLLPVASSAPLDERAHPGEQLQLLTPAVDGEYYLTLCITDAQERADHSTAVFRVEDGRASEVDLATAHSDWIDHAVVYGVVPYFFGPDGFTDITERLDEIAKLGATAIWLSPVSDAPADDFGYAVKDHFSLRPSFGSEAEFRALVARAHALGLRVILDFIPNHVSDQHPYYVHADKFGPRSPYYDWFERDQAGNVLTYFDWDNLINLDYDNPEVQNHILAASAYWLTAFDIDGFRVDVGWGVRQRAPEFWRRWREELKRIKPDIFLLAEASARDRFYLRNGFDVAYDWTDNLGEWAWEEAFRDGRAVDLDALRTALDREHNDAYDSLIFRFLNNNDTGQRFVSRHGVALTRVAAALQFTLPGIPLIYTGDEIGADFEPYDEGPPLHWHDRAGLTPHYARLAQLRRTTPALWSSQLKLVGNDQEQRVLSYVRPGVDDGPAVLVVLNFSNHPLLVTLPQAAPNTDAIIPRGQLLDLLSDDVVNLDPAQPRLQLPAYGAMILQQVE